MHLHESAGSDPGPLSSSFDSSHCHLCRPSHHSARLQLSHLPASHLPLQQTFAAQQQENKYLASLEMGSVARVGKKKVRVKRKVQRLSKEDLGQKEILEFQNLTRRTSPLLLSKHQNCSSPHHFQLQIRIQKLQALLEDSHQENDLVAKELAKVRVRNSQLAKALQDGQGQLSQLKMNSALNGQRQRSLQAELTRLKSIQNDKLALNSQLSMLEISFKRAEVQLQQKDKYLRLLQSQLSQANAERNQLWRRAQASLGSQEQQSALRERNWLMRVQQLQKRLQLQEKKSSNQTAQCAKTINSLQKKISEHKLQKQQADLQIQELFQQLNLLSQENQSNLLQISRCPANQRDVESIAHELSQSLNSCRQLRTKVQGLQRQLQRRELEQRQQNENSNRKIQQIRKQSKSKDQQLMHSTLKIRELEHLLNQAHSASQTLQHALSSFHHLQNHSQHLEQHATLLAQRLHQATLILREKEDSERELQQRLQKNQQKLAQKEGQCARCSEQLKSQRRLVNELGVQVQRFQMKMQLFGELQSQQRLEIEDKAKTCLRLDNQLQLVRQTLSSRQRQLSEKGQLLLKSQESGSQLGVELTHLEKENKRLRQDLDQLKKEFRQVQRSFGQRHQRQSQRTFKQESQQAVLERLRQVNRHALQREDLILKLKDEVRTLKESVEQQGQQDRLKVQSLKSANKKLQKLNEEQRQDQLQLRKQISNLKNQISQGNAASQANLKNERTLAEKLRLLQAQHDRYQDSTRRKLQYHDHERQKLFRQSQELGLQLQSCRELVRSLKQQMSIKSSQIVRLQQELSILRKQREDAEEQIQRREPFGNERLKGESDLLREQLRQALQQNQEVRRKVQQLIANISQLLQQQSRLKAHLQVYQQIEFHLQAQNSRIAGSLQSCQQGLSQAQHSLLKVSQENSKLKNQFKNAEMTIGKAKIQIQSLQERQKQARQKCSLIQQDNARLKARLSNDTALFKLNQPLKQSPSLAKLTQLLSSQKQENELIRTQKCRLEESLRLCQRQVSQLKWQLKNSPNRHLDQSMLSMGSESNFNLALVSKLQSDLTSKREENRQLRRQIQLLEEQIQNGTLKTQRINSHFGDQRRLDICQQECKVLERQLTSLKDQNARLSSELSLLRNQNFQLKSQRPRTYELQSAKKENETLRQQLRANRETHLRQIATLKLQIADLTDLVEDTFRQGRRCNLPSSSGFDDVNYQSYNQQDQKALHLNSKGRERELEQKRLHTELNSEEPSSQPSVFVKDDWDS